MQIERLGRARAELLDGTRSWKGRDLPMARIRSVCLSVWAGV